MTAADGLAVIDKEAGWTSHDVVAKARGVFGTRRVGHSGTLDPDATGVLLLGVGRATRLLRFLTPLPKRYVGELVLGAETSTLDASGEVTAVHDMSAVTPHQVSEAAARFVGDIMQVPPMVSAIKVGGRRLHELAREGIEIEREARPVTVHEMAVAPVDARAGVYRIEVSCSSGTYVRSLAADIGSALGGGGHLRALRRVAVGSFTIEEARPIGSFTIEEARPIGSFTIEEARPVGSFTIEEARPIGSFTIEEARPIGSPELLSMETALRDYPSVSVDADLSRRVANGQVLAFEDIAAEGDGPWAVYGVQGQLLAVYETHKPGMVKPAVVIPS